MELRPSQIERIKRYELSRHRKAKPTLTSSQHVDRIIGLFGLGIALLIFAMLFLISVEWQPGNQAQIAFEYRALRHNAVAVEEWK